MIEPYNDVYVSILSYLNGFLTRNSITGFEVFDFETHATENEFPDAHLIGIGDYGITNEQDLYYIEAMIIVSTKSDDVDLKVLRSTVNTLFTELRPGETGDRFRVYDKDSNEKGYLIIKSPVAVSPVGSMKVRPVQMISLGFALGYDNSQLSS